MSRRPSLMTRRSSNQSLLEHFNRIASKEEFEKVRDKWFAACIAENLSLHTNVLLEFTKRIERCGSFGERAKLDLSNCELDDRRLTLLIEALAKKPVIYKIDLANNRITNEGVKVIRKLLKGQMKLAKDFPIDKRLYASFLAEVELDGNLQITDYKLLEKLNDTLRVLKYCNAQAHIRSVFVSSNAPDELSFPFVMKMWLNIIGKPDRDQITPAFSNAGVDEKGVIMYKDLEAVLMQGLMSKGLFLPLSAEEIAMVTRVEPKGRKNSLDPATMQNILQLRDQPKTSQDVLEGVSEKKEDRKVQRRLKSKDTITDDDDEDEYVEEITDVDRIMEPLAAKLRAKSRDAADNEEKKKKHNKKEVHLEITEYDDRLENEDVSGLSSQSATPIQPGRKSYGDNDDSVLTAITSTPSPTKTSMLQDSPAHTARVNTAEVYADQEGFLEHNPMLHEAEEGDPSASANLAKYLTNQHLPTPLHPADNAHSFSFRSDNFLTTHNEISEAEQQSPSATHPPVNTEHVGVHHTHMESYEDSESDDGGHDSDEYSEQHDLPPDSNYMLYPSDEKLAATTLLTLSHKRLRKVKFTKYIEINQFAMIRILVLRNNEISDVRKLRLFRALPFLTDLDLGFNLIAGKIEDDVFPRKLQRLDLSYNQITDVSGLMTCIDLVELNLCHNHMKNLYGLPTKIERLDISDNQLITVASLRSLTLCFGLQYISIRNNPMNATVPNMKVFLKSLFINLKEFDGIRIGPTKFKRAEDLQDKGKHRYTAEHTSKKEQEMNDALRSQIYLIKKKQIEDARSRSDKLLQDEFVSYQKKTLPPEQVQNLAQRLAVPKFVTHKVEAKSQHKEEARPRKAASPVKRAAGQRTAAMFEPATRPTPHQSMIAKAVVSSSVLQKRSNNRVGTSTTAGMEKGVALQSYRDSLKAELVKISSVFKVTFGLVGKPSVETTDLASFNAFNDKVKESQVLEISPPSIVELVEGKEFSIVHKELVCEIRRLRDEYEKGAILLQQMQTAIMLSAESGSLFADSVDLLMNSKLGNFVNESILKRYNCEYDYREYKRQHPKSASKSDNSHFQSPQKRTANSPERKLVPTTSTSISGKSTSSALQNQSNLQKPAPPVATRSRSAEANVPPPHPAKGHHTAPPPPPASVVVAGDDFTHQVIDPMASSSCESSPVAKLSKGIAGENNSVLDNVRNRIAQKLLPPDIASSMRSKDEENVKITTSRERQLDDGHIFGSMPTLRPVDSHNKKLGDSNVFGSMPQLKHIEITKDSTNGTSFIEAPEELSLKERMKLFSRESAPPKPKTLSEIGSRYNLRSPLGATSASPASPASQSFHGSIKSPKAHHHPTGSMASPTETHRSPSKNPSALQRTHSSETMKSPDHHKKTSSDHARTPPSSSRNLGRQDSFRALQKTGSSENMKSPSHNKTLSKSPSMKSVKSDEDISHSASSSSLSARDRLRLRMKKSSENLTNKTKTEDPLADIPIVSEVDPHIEDAFVAIPEGCSDSREGSPTPSEGSTMSARDRLRAKMAAKKTSSAETEVETAPVEEVAVKTDSLPEHHDDVIDVQSEAAEETVEQITAVEKEEEEKEEEVIHIQENIHQDTEELVDREEERESLDDIADHELPVLAEEQQQDIHHVAEETVEPLKEPEQILDAETTEPASEAEAVSPSVEEPAVADSSPVDSTMSARDRLRAKLAQKRNANNASAESGDMSPAEDSTN